jgi:type VI secretion system secreted protein Hcp
MRKGIIWVVGALVLIAVPAIVGLVVFRDGGSTSARRAGALVPAGGTTAYQLQLTTPAAGGSPVGAKDEAIEVESFSWGSENPTTIGSATGGAGAGKIKFNELTIVKKVDKASPALFKNEATGSHYPVAVLSLRKAGAKEPYLNFTMKTVFTTKIAYSGDSPEVVTEEITFVFGSVAIEVIEGGGVPVQAGWDQVLNKAATP